MARVPEPVAVLLAHPARNHPRRKGPRLRARRHVAREIYHDFYRWPWRDRAVFERWRSTTPWGHRFDRYARAGEVPVGEPTEPLASASV